jgi:hypothetical protein
MNKPMDLNDFLNQVVDESTFLAFARALADDRRASVEAEALRPSSPYGSEARDWENVTIERFLDAAVGWAEDTELGKSQGILESNPWKRFAAFLYCGKIYE